MVASSDFREYENGIADVLASVVGDTGIVQRNVKLLSRSGGKRRQIDVLVVTTSSGVTNTRTVVDCKRWNTRIDKPGVEKFIGVLDDVGADMGILVSAAGFTSGAASRAQTARGVRVKTLSVRELMSWRPPGTVFKTLEIRQASLEKAAKELREAGLRVTARETEGEYVRIEVFRHHGIANPPGQIQQAQHELTEAALNRLGIPYKSLGQGVTINGGTPNHRWLDVHIPGSPLVMKVLAADESKLEAQLVMLASEFGMPRELLTVDRPNGWPCPNSFPF